MREQGVDAWSEEWRRREEMERNMREDGGNREGRGEVLIRRRRMEMGHGTGMAEGTGGRRAVCAL